MIVAGMAGAIVIIILLGVSWTYDYDNATPPDTGESPRLGASRIRELKNAMQERLNVCGYWPWTGTEVSDACAGEMRRILFHAPIASTPTVAANHGDLRLKDFNSKAELTWTDEDEHEIQLTSAGTLNIVEADLLGTLTNNTYFTSIDNAGTGTVDLIKANASDAAVIPDGSELATSGAPTADADIVNKKYVDDNIPAITIGFQAPQLTDDGAAQLTYATVYKAMTDGDVNAWGYTGVSGGSGNAFVGATSNPTTAMGVSGQAGIYRWSLSFPVKKDYYWKVTLTGISPTLTDLVWTPATAGTAAPEKQ